MLYHELNPASYLMTTLFQTFFLHLLVHNENDIRFTIAVSLSMAMADHVVFVLIIS